MRSSVLLTSALAALAIASPIKAIAKKEYVYDATTEIVYVTVTMEAPATTPSSSHHHHASSSNYVKTVKVSTTVVVGYSASVPVPSSTYVAPLPSTTSVIAPEPTSVTPIAIAPTTTSTTPVPEPTTSAPVVAQVAAPAVAEPVVAPSKAVALAVASASPSAAPGTAAAPATATKPTDYQGLALWHHNKHRANHTANGLTWSSDLASRALKTANTCVFAHDMYEGGGGYGQNIAAYGSTNLAAASNNGAVADAITNQWYYGEAANMPYGVDTPDINGPEFLHFSAMLWKDSTTVGCATVTCPAGTVFQTMSALYTVCNYASTGNIIGEFASQVTKPLGLASIDASATSS